MTKSIEARSAQPDAIELELLNNALASAADQMAYTVLRTSYSIGIKAGMDFSTALVTAEGETLAQGLCLPLHLGAVPAAVQAVRQRFIDDMRPGDIFAFNDPFSGGMHLPDIFVVRPVFDDLGLLGFAVAVSHHQDVGGRVPGSCAVDSVDIFSEGLRIPPMRIYEGGRVNETLMTMLEYNVREPQKLLGDVRAELSACQVGANELGVLSRQYGASTVRRLFMELIDLAERETRREIARIPDGTYSFTDYLDDSATSPEPVRICVSITVKGDEIFADFEGTSAQVRAALNSTLPCTQAGVLVAVKSLIDPDIPNNQGFMRPVHVSVPSGTILNPVWPAATGARGVTVFRMVDAVFGAFAQALPDRVFAAGEGGNSNIRIGGRDRSGNSFLLVDIIVGAWGGRPYCDGIDGIANIATNLSNAPVELLEAEFPVRVNKYAFVPDTGGPGQFRGGLSIVRELEFLGEDATMQLRSDRRRFRPYGLQGGGQGSPSMNILNAGGPGEQELPSKVVVPIKHGDVITHQTAGAGGYGNPLLRDPAAVLADAIDEKVTFEHALSAYGVVVDSASLEVDEGATAAARSQRLRGAPDLSFALTTAPSEPSH